MEKKNKNILIRNLTEDQNKRLQQLQTKFGVKTNSQALLMLLQYCVITDDEISDLIELYTQFGLFAFAGMKILKENGSDEQATQIEALVSTSIRVARKMEYLLSLRK